MYARVQHALNVRSPRACVFCDRGWGMACVLGFLWCLRAGRLAPTRVEWLSGKLLSVWCSWWALLLMIFLYSFYASHSRACFIYVICFYDVSFFNCMRFCMRIQKIIIIKHDFPPHRIASARSDVSHAVFFKPLETTFHFVAARRTEIERPGYISAGARRHDAQVARGPSGRHRPDSDR